jgi:polyhydroxyalkanoate synthesis regulator phasin
MIDLLKKTLLAGVGAAVVTKDKIESALDDFVRQGKVNAADARIMAEKIAEQGRREFDELAAELNAKFRDSFAHTDAATQKRLAELEARVRVLESKLAEPPTRANEP